MQLQSVKWLVWIQNPILSRDDFAIISSMLAATAIITMACKGGPADITSEQLFKIRYILGNLCGNWRLVWI